MLRFAGIVLFLLIIPFRSFGQEGTRGQDSDRLYVASIVIEGNRVTKKSVITREMMVAEGDSVKKSELISLLQKSRENLLNTSLFNFVTMDARHYPGNRIDVLVTVTERWYIWPVPILEHADRNFSEFLHNWDWSRINYGAWLKWENFRGRRELLTGKVRLGYKEQYSLGYSKPNLGKYQQHGIDFGFNFDRQHEIIYGSQDNSPLNHKEDPGYAFSQENVYFTYTFRKKIYTVHTVKFEYFNFWAADTIIRLNPNYFGNGNNRMNFFMLTYNFQFDNRDSKIYPLEGFAFKGRIEKLGLGIIEDFPYPNWWFTSSILYHHQLSPRFFFATANKGKYSVRKDLPYFHQKALGYNEYMSGYEYYVIDGTDYFLSKLIFKYMLVKPRAAKIPFINFEQFTKFHYAIYLNLFGDAGYVYNEAPEPGNLMANKMQYSCGIGLDFVTYYDQVLRIEYSVNRYLNRGFFIHMETPFRRW
ncbi:MAG: POTRA domain-containing protein [Bacteroidota bacterium]